MPNSSAKCVPFILFHFFSTSRIWSYFPMTWSSSVSVSAPRAACSCSSSSPAAARCSFGCKNRRRTKMKTTARKSTNSWTTHRPRGQAAQLAAVAAAWVCQLNWLVWEVQTVNYHTHCYILILTFRWPRTLERFWSQTLTKDLRVLYYNLFKPVHE